MKRIALALAAAGLLAAPAFAQAAKANDTLKAVIAKGVMLDVQGMPVDIAYKDDGTFTGMGGQIAGTWKADGAKMCITIPGMVENQCTDYPAGKGPGDSFVLTSDQGSMTVTINK